ncbi:MAG: hypothetical protein OES69_07140 [Myxococcales bacterium]|nr:hypothetical protein [Myxococcales bacterium]MDH3843696.1 hypothetical protein [Myxococcales bacterium]
MHAEKENVRRSPRGIALAACLLACSVANLSAAEAAEPEPDEAAEVGEERERLNGLTLGGAYTFHILRDRDSATTGEPLKTIEHLGGFVIAYDRELIPQHLALTISKPFYFSKERFDTPFDFILKGLFRKGSWEGFIGLVLTWNIRVFEKEREEKEGERNILSFGIGAVIGGAYFFNPRWSLDLEVGYANVPTDDIVEHEVSAALAGTYHF